MRAILLLIITTCLFGQIVKAQSTPDIGKISFSVVMPDNFEKLEVSQLSKIQTKILNIITSNGIGATGNNTFVIYPKFTIYESNVVEGGLQNITVVKCELSLFVKQVESNLLFSSVSKTIIGSGKNELSAVTNAISKIDSRDNEYKNFIESTKTKILKYYESKCSNIIMQAENLVKKQNYSQAFGLLMSVPEEVSCYDKVQEKSVEIYKSYQNFQCKSLAHNINVSIASKDYVKAISYLGYIDPTTTCYPEVKNMIKKMETQLDEYQKKQLELQMKVYENQVELEKQRINAVKEIAVSYYQNQPIVDYYFLIR